MYGRGGGRIDELTDDEGSGGRTGTQSGRWAKPRDVHTVDDKTGSRVDRWTGRGGMEERRIDGS